jgi:hypothetical protein
MEDLEQGVQRVVLIDSFEHLEEAQRCADRALIRRYLMQGKPVRRLNHEHLRRFYMFEEATQLLARHMPGQQPTHWFLYQPELAYLLEPNPNNAMPPVEDEDMFISIQELLHNPPPML